MNKIKSISKQIKRDFFYLTKIKIANSKPNPLLNKIHGDTSLANTHKVKSQH